jgi:hypothetical protein
MHGKPGRYALTATLLSSAAFGAYIAHRGESYASLAAEVTRRGTKVKPVPVKCSKATIGHLVTGKVRGTSPKRAKLIEEALNAPVGSLFMYRVTRVSQDARLTPEQAMSA